MDITLAKAITDFGILVVIAAIFLVIAVIVSKKILKDAAKDRAQIDALNSQIQADHQRQIDELKKKLDSIQTTLNRQTPAVIRLADRAVKAIERMNDCVRYCQKGRTGDTPSDPDESDIEAIIAASEEATKIETAAIEPKK
jgi:hypothetical protein